MSNSKSSKIEKKFNTIAVIVLIALVLLGIVGIYVLLLTLHLNSPIEAVGDNYTKSDLGTLGDLVGGLINPVLTFLTIGLLIFSIRLQGKELKEATEQSRRAANSLAQTNEIHNSNLEEQKRLLLIPQLMEKLNAEVSILRSLYWKRDQYETSKLKKSLDNVAGEKLLLPPLSKILTRVIDNEGDFEKMFQGIELSGNKEKIENWIGRKFDSCTLSIMEISNVCKSLKHCGAPNVLYSDELNQAIALNDILNSSQDKLQKFVQLTRVVVVKKVTGHEHIDRPSMMLLNNENKGEGKPFVFVYDESKV